MKEKLLKKYFISIISLFAIMDIVFISQGDIALAKEESLFIVGSVFEYEGDEDYVISDSSKASKTTENNVAGKLSIRGDVQFAGSDIYYINSGNIEFSYKFSESVLEALEDEWHLTEDKTKIVDEINIGDKVSRGAIIIQTSMDGEDWVEDAVITDIFSETSGSLEAFYSSKAIHQLNGCYYRIIIVYKMQRKEEDKKILFVDVDNYKEKRVAEVYSFYVINQETVENGTTTANDLPKKIYNDKVNTGKDNGYDIETAVRVDNGDPHFGWNLGVFTINGYTRETQDENGNKVFLKTVGDNITLWFTLEQDINRLDGKENLSISEDINGYDKNFEIKQTNFKHGTLIVKYTDDQGNTHDPVVYTDFLLANTKTGADTRIELYEEGDYEVALDYEIKSLSGPLSIVKSYNNYKMYFKFSIRNGNTMVFPKDAVTGAELADGAITPNGFSIDMAQSKYLTIDVVRTSLKVNSDGTLSIDVRSNAVSKDNSIYSKEGIYAITVKNLYSDGEPTVKTIFVGTDKYLMALAKSGYSVDQLNEHIRRGIEISDDGSLVEPAEESVAEETESPAIENGETKTIEEEPTENKDVDKLGEVVDEGGKDTIPISPEENKQKPDIKILLTAGVLAIIIVMIIVIRKKKR